METRVVNKVAIPTVERNLDSGHADPTQPAPVAPLGLAPDPGRTGPGRGALLVFCTTFLIGFWSMAAMGQTSLPAIEEQLRRLESTGAQAWARWGEHGHTAVLVGPTTVIVALHCVELEGVERIYFEFNDGFRAWGQVERVDRDLDLAVVRLQPGHGHEPLNLVRPEGMPRRSMVWIPLHHASSVPFVVQWQRNADSWWARISEGGSPEYQAPRNDEIVSHSLASEGVATHDTPICPMGSFFAAVQTPGSPAPDDSWATIGEAVNGATRTETASIRKEPSVQFTTYRSTTVAPTGMVVTVYSAPWCNICRQLEMWLRTHEVPFIEVDIEKQADAWRDAKQRAEASGVHVTGIPLTEISDGIHRSFVTGFDEISFSQSLRSLGLGTGD